MNPKYHSDEALELNAGVPQTDRQTERERERERERGREGGWKRRTRSMAKLPELQVVVVMQNIKE